MTYKEFVFNFESNWILMRTILKYKKSKNQFDFCKNAIKAIKNIFEKKNTPNI